MYIHNNPFLLCLAFVSLICRAPETESKGVEEKDFPSPTGEMRLSEERAERRF